MKSRVIRKINKIGNIVDKNQRKYNMFVFLSTFARQLIEAFIPIILYKAGFTLKEVIFYYFLVNLFSFVMAPVALKIAKKTNYKVLAAIGVVSFTGLQILLSNVQLTLWYLFAVSFLYAGYRRGYWISRRYYNLKVVHKKNISMSYTFIAIVNQLACLFATYIGALLLDFMDIKILTTIAIALFFVSIIPLVFMKFKEEKKIEEEKIDLFGTLKEIPANDKFIFGAYETLNVVRFLFPLYLTLYVKDTYQIVGFLQLVTNVATIVFAYLYGKKINKNSVNYLSLSMFLMIVVYIFKANVTGILLVLVSLAEGFVSKMNDISTQKEFIKLSKKFNYENYNYAYEWIQNIFRVTLTAIMVLFISDIRVMIYLTLALQAFIIPLKFKYVRKKDYKDIMEEKARQEFSDKEIVKDS